MKFIYSLMYKINCALFPKARAEAASIVYILTNFSTGMPEEESALVDELADAYEAYVTRFGNLPENPNPVRHTYLRNQEDWDAYYEGLDEELAEIAKEETNMKDGE